MPTNEGNALYRKYRPQTFAELIGQETVVESLTNAIRNDRLSHAYLFSGPLGTGKTTTALIFAKSLNCEKRKPGEVEPCNQCSSCINIMSSSSLDVIEHDSAFTSGVDAMRDIISKVEMSSPGNKKIIIFDEAHQLSNAAMSSLLTTSERLSERVIFLFVTTDSHKILNTLYSRLRKVFFKIVHPEVMSNYLTEVADRAGIEYTPEMIREAVLQGKGSVRNALSGLDSLLDEKEIPASPAVLVMSALATVHEGNAQQGLRAVLEAVAQSHINGASARTLAESMFELLRECFLIQMNAESVLTTPDWGNRNQIAQQLGPKRTVQMIDLLATAVTSMQADYDARINLEIALSRYCHLVGS